MCWTTSWTFWVCCLGLMVILKAPEPSSVHLHRVDVGRLSLPFWGMFLLFQMWQELSRFPMRTTAALPQNASSLGSLSSPRTAESSAQRHRLPPGPPLTPSGGFHHPLGSCLSWLSQWHPVIPRGSARLSRLPTTLSVTTPPSAQTTQLIEEVQKRQPQGAQVHSPPSLGSVLC